uniref:phosphoacetylglucosamine mutase n=2 Tax=Mesocestoides corti TaxID=53468 RepID=A0A5K3F368_MESCO
MEVLSKELSIFFESHRLSQESLALSYGTPGYRCKATFLHGIAARIGAYACLRSAQQNGLAVGVMITASHNAAEDNGLKLINTDGGMLSPDLEPSVIEFVRMSADRIKKWLEDYFGEKPYDPNIEPMVFVGWDTRKSSVGLAEEVEQGIVAAGGKYVDFGLVTTPQLHYLVQNQSRQRIPDRIEDYVSVFTNRFVKALSTLRGGPINLNVDCAHGVGALTLTSLSTRLYLEYNKPSYPSDSPQLCIRTYNTLTSDKELLNRECGADFVKLYSKQPKLTPTPPEPSPFAPSTRWATIDGDGDRLLYFFTSPAASTAVCLLDGDRIAALFATFIADQLRQLGGAGLHLGLGVVQTAYANSASTRYFHRELGGTSQVVCTLTGVKHLHKAAKAFDFGVYFEANGHGTVELSQAAIDFVSTLPEKHPLKLFVSLVNTAVGDAITDILLVEYVLAVRGIRSLADWFAVYTDLPSRQLKVVIADRAVIETTDADRKVLKPEGLQGAIDALVQKVDMAVNTPGISRAFIRPSGTEDVVRVYAESSKQDLADWLAEAVACLVHRHANGVGPEPAPMGPVPT